MFVLGGGLAEGADLYLDPIQRWFTELLYAPELRPHPALAFAELGERAGAIGAAMLLPSVTPDGRDSQGPEERAPADVERRSLCRSIYAVIAGVAVYVVVRFRLDELEPDVEDTARKFVGIALGLLALAMLWFLGVAIVSWGELRHDREHIHHVRGRALERVPRVRREIPSDVRTRTS